MTDCYLNGSGNMSAFIQSKDAYGNVSGALLYNYGTTYLTPNTTLIEITGKPNWFFGQLRFNISCTYIVKSTDWYTPETNYMTASDWVDSSTNASVDDPLWQAALPYGQRKTTLKNITIQSSTNNQAYGTFESSSKRALFYFNDVTSTLKNSLSNTFSSFAGQTVDVTGYLHCYKSTTNTMELQMCNINDIVESNTTPVSVSDVSLDITSETLNVGSSLQLNATVTPINATNKNVVWESTNSNIVSVDNGLITAHQLGNATITVTTIDGNHQAQCLVTVTNNPIHVTSVSLNKHDLTLSTNDTFTLTATVLPSTATNKNVSWHSNNASVATVTNGLVTATGIGVATITVTTIDGGLIDSCYISVEEVPLTEMTIDKTAGFGYGGYSTNFGKGTYKSISYGFYRAGKDNANGGMIALFNSTDFYDYNSLSGAFFNDTAISGIKQITVSYKATDGLTIKYGVTKTRGYSQTLAPSSASSWTTTTISCSVSSCYFSIETNSSNVYINSITIGYTSTMPINNTTTQVTDYRIAPTVFSGPLVDGESSISVPYDITVTGNTYTVNSYKTYTYYSYDYVNSNQSSLNLASIAMTDPVDVSNYYIAFHAIPANFGYGNDVDEECATITQVNNLFGDDARSVKQYYRTNGYATAVSWNTHAGTSEPLYYEFDIGLDASYTTDSRGVGRVVVWIDGWSCYSGNTPVAVFTDDHYATFGEYLNYGAFGTRFDSQASSGGHRTGYTNLQGSTLLNQA